MVDYIEEDFSTYQNNNNPFKTDVLLLVQTGFDDGYKFQGEIQTLIQYSRAFSNGKIIEDFLVKTKIEANINLIENIMQLLLF